MQHINTNGVIHMGQMQKTLLPGKKIPVFYEIINENPMMRIITFLINGKGLDYSVSDIAEGISVNGIEIHRLKVYRILKKLVAEKIVITRKTSNVPLYKINTESKKARLLMKFHTQLINDLIKAFE